MTAPISDDALIALAQHRFEQADREGAAPESCRQALDIFPAVLQRLREKVAITRDLTAPDPVAIDAPKGWQKQASSAARTAVDGQLQLSLLHL
ncbi:MULTISPECIES: hypothetical protein [unclassified Novosphingobium]|uniref:hypothetical protein n=1 Tax=unclassified Novosphingobium TaxID=2644732 RepID=UPI00135B3257|nr:MULTISPECIES: hypothetical protein [unclassified Novosphingobium]